MEEEAVSDVTNNNTNKCHIQGVTLGESNTDTGSCDSLLEIVNYLDSEDCNFDGNFDSGFPEVSGVAESESENCGVTVGDVSGRNVDLPDVSVITNERLTNGVKRSSSVRSDISDHIISQFLDRSVDGVGFWLQFFLSIISGNIYQRTPARYYLMKAYLSSGYIEN